MSEKKKSNSTNRLRLKPDEVELIERYRLITKHANDAGLDVKDAKHGWLKSDSASIFFTNPLHEYPNAEEEVKEFDFEKALKNVKKVKVDSIAPTKDLNARFDRLVISDVHLGMDPSDKGQSLYDSSWVQKDIDHAVKEIVTHTIKNQKSTDLYIVELGDFFDGLNGTTTRGGHHLAQNMSNQEVFDCGLRFKLSIIESLIPYYDKITFHNINNDNHSADFSYFLNSSLKQLCDRMYDNVFIVNQLKFIDYTIINNYCFVTTHGKDSVHMKHGLKAKIDDRGISRITEYLAEENLLNKGYIIIFEKGDSHQYLFDNASSDIFSYYNYPALSPSSNWVQTNFKRGRRGFIHFNYFEESKSINEYFFKK